MSTLHRLKAYFGMVPADELDGDAYDGYRGDGYGADKYGTDEYDEREPAQYEYERAGRTERRLTGRSTRWEPRDSRDSRDYDDYYEDEPEPPARRTPPRRSWADTPVRGALAVDPVREPAARVTPPPVEEVHPLSRITTLHPSSYMEARGIGEHYREGIPVIMNLTAMDDADAKRLVDFAAGLAFALRGSMDKVTTKVFLISPANVDVTAEDKRRMAEGSFLPPHFNRA